MIDRRTSLDKNDAIPRYETIEKKFLVYMPTTTPTNLLLTTLGIFLSADYPRPHGPTISRLPLFDNLSPDYPALGSREIGGVYSRYSWGYWGSREIFAEIEEMNQKYGGALGTCLDQDFICPLTRQVNNAGVLWLMS